MAAMHPPMEVLSSRLILRPSDPPRTRRFYRDTLGLAVYREFGPADSPGTVFFLGGGFLEVTSGGRGEQPPGGMVLWLQVRDVDAEHSRLAAAGARVTLAPEDMPWGLREMEVEGPDGLPIRVIQVPDEHPLRRRV